MDFRYESACSILRRTIDSVIWSGFKVVAYFLQGVNEAINRLGQLRVHVCLAALVRRVLRVHGSGMKSHCASAPVPPEPIRLVRRGIEQKATKGTKKEIPGLCLLRFLL